MSHADSADFQLVSEAGPAPEQPLTAVSVGSGDLLAVSYGGGDNSWAMLLGMAERGIRPDFIAMADTKGEKPNTYSHLREVAMPWVARTWGLEIQIVKKLYAGEWEGLEGQCLRHGELPSLAYGRRSCSQKYKHEMLERALAEYMQARAYTLAVKAIGYHAMEGYRARKAPLRKEIRAGIVEGYWYPLIEWQWRPEDCIAAGKRHGLPMPGKSACFFCPASKPSEVFALRDNHPGLLARALEIESRAQPNLTTKRGLGGAGNLWADWLAKDAAQIKIPDIRPVDVPCGCFDGGEEFDSANDRDEPTRKSGESKA